VLLEDEALNVGDEWRRGKGEEEHEGEHLAKRTAITGAGEMRSWDTPAGYGSGIPPPYKLPGEYPVPDPMSNPPSMSP